MRKIAFVDLDDTLFDVKKFKDRYFNYLSPYFPIELVSETYKQAKAGGYFDADAHCFYLEKSMAEYYGISTSAKSFVDAKSLVEDWFMLEQKILQSFVFPDTELFLRLLGSYGYEVYILTLGTDWFQKAKIEGAELLPFISGYRVTQDPTKISAIKCSCNPEINDVVLFDDSWRVIDATKQTFPKVFAVQVLRKDEDISKKAARADAIARNLGEAMGAILSRPR